MPGGTIPTKENIIDFLLFLIDNEPINKKDLLVSFKEKTGSSQRTTRRHIKLLLEKRILVEKGGKIISVNWDVLKMKPVIAI